MDFSKEVQYRGIRHNVENDAPFIGAVVLAPYCRDHCEGCHNQHLKESPILTDTYNNILDEIEEDSFNNGIILGGLEWTDAPRGMYKLIREAVRRNMNVFLYTYMTEEQFANKFPSLYKKPIWIKFGKFDKDKKGHNVQHGIKLSTTNQHIKFLGGDKNGR